MSIEIIQVTPQLTVQGSSAQRLDVYAAYETGLTLLAKLLGVDGTGSGLDADLLDGKDSTLFALLNQNATFANLIATGNTTLGDAAADTLTVLPNAITWSSNPTHSGNHTFGAALTVAGAFAANGGVTLGDAAGDALTIASAAVTWSGNPTHSGNHTFSSALTIAGALAANGGVTLGDASADSLTINSSGASIPNGLSFTGGRVGVGGVVVGNPLEVVGDASAFTLGLRGRSLDDLSIMRFLNYAGSTEAARLRADVDGTFYLFNTATTQERLRVTPTGNLGVGTVNVSNRLTVAGNITLGDPTRNQVATLGIELKTNGDPATNDRAAIYLNTTAGAASSDSYITFVTNQYGISRAERMRIDAVGNVGIGVTPVSRLDVNGNLTLRGDIVSANDSFAYTISGGSTYAAGGAIQYYGSTHATHPNKLMGLSNGATRWIVSADGRFTVGPSEGPSQLNVKLATGFAGGNAWNGGTATFGGAGAGGNFGIAYDDTQGALLMSIVPGVSWKDLRLAGSNLIFAPSNTEAMRVAGNGQVLIDTTTAGIGNNAAAWLSVGGAHTSSFISVRASGTQEAIVGADASGVFGGSWSAHDYSIRTNNTERMRFLSGGAIGMFGTTPSGFDLDLGTSGRSIGGVGNIAGFTDSGAYSIWGGRSSLNGGYLQVYGASHATLPNLVIIGTNNSVRMRFTATGSVEPGSDNTQTLGSAGSRWSTVYAGTGTINTSDAREKTPVRPLTPSEIGAAKQLASELGAFRFLTAVAAKGDLAREHIGMTVQRAIQILQDNELDPFDYGFICHDSWDETEDAPAGDRYAFRSDELLLFIARGFHARLETLEAAATIH